MMTFHRLRKPWSRAVPLGAFALLLLFALAPRESSAQLRPLVRDMLDNLSAVNRIAEGVALDDWDQIEDSARDLRSRALSMQLLDLETLRMDRSQDALWDAFLMAQEKAARDISLAVRNSDSRGVLAGTQQLVGNACVGCHAAFRDPQNRLRGSVLFMTTFLASWQDINRGMMIRNFDLVKTRALELAALTEIVGTPEVMEEEFGKGGRKQQRQFGEFLAVVTTNANAIAAAAENEDIAQALTASTAMWSDGCVGCHDKFRN